MRAAIISGGRRDSDFIFNYLKIGFDYLVAADSGLEFFYEKNIFPNVIMGDFDSVDRDILSKYENDERVKIIYFNPIKDDTDTALAVNHAIDAGADEIHILGATGSRIDHFLGNLGILFAALKRGIDAFIVDKNNRIRIVRPGRTVIRKDEQFGDNISLIPFLERVEDLTLKGFYYNVEKFCLEREVSRGLSNILTDDTGIIEFSNGFLCVIESCD